VMNYPFRDAILAFLLGGSSRDFYNRVWSVVENYPPQTLRLLMNHIGTHDTERALTLLGGEPSHGRGRAWQAAQTMTPDQRRLALTRLRLATLLQFALPGVPCIYSGDEAALEGHKDPFNRHTYPWDGEDADLLAWYRRLGDARRDAAVLAEGGFAPVPTTEDVVCFVRRDSRSRLLCAVNRGTGGQVVRLPADFADATVRVGDGRVDGDCLILPPMSGVWLC